MDEASERAATGERRLDDLSEGLHRLRHRAGQPSYAEIASGVADLRASRGSPHDRPGRVTVYDAFRAGRRRLDMSLVLDIVHVLAGPEGVKEWRDAYLAALQPEPGKALAAIPAEPVVHSAFLDRSPLVGAVHHLAGLRKAETGTVTLVHGLPGAGKTELAVAAASAAADEGIRALLVACRGYDGAAADYQPQQIARALLRTLGLSPDHINHLDDDALLRALATELGREPTLLVLDDVGPRSRVRRLLLAASARIIVTSRHRLDIGADANVWLDVLGPDDAVSLLGQHIGPDRVAAEPAAARELVALCSHLPLEIIVASRSVKSRPTWTLADHVRRLGELGTDSGVRSALVDSYSQLPPDAARAFRLLTLHPGSAIRIDAVAALAGLPLSRAAAVVGTLRQAHLLLPDADSAAWHDVVRRFARDRLLEEEPHSSQRAALARLLDFYVAALLRANSVLYPGLSGHVNPPATDPELLDLDDADQHQAFFDSEREAVARLAQLAAGWGMSTPLSDLSALMFGYLSVSAYLREAVALHRLASEHGAPDRRGQALRHTARILEEQGRYAEALAELDDAQVLEEHEVERVHQAQGNVWLRMEHYDEAVSCYELALEHATRAGNQLHAGFAQANLAEALRLRGDLARATELADAAMSTFADLGNEAYRSVVQGNRGLIAAAAGDADLARELLTDSAVAAEATGNTAHATRMLSALAVVELDHGRPDAAVAALSRGEHDVGADRRPDVYLEILATRARIDAAAGRVDAARGHYQEIVRLARRTRTSSALAHAHQALADLDHEN